MMIWFVLRVSIKVLQSWNAIAMLTPETPVRVIITEPSVLSVELHNVCRGLFMPWALSQKKEKKKKRWFWRFPNRDLSAIGMEFLDSPPP